MRYTVWCLCAALWAVAACGGEPAARAVILQPADGDTLGSDVRVLLGAEGVEVVPADGQRVAGRGHHHLFIDTDPSPPGAAIPAGVPGIVHLGTGAGEWTVPGLAPGEHRIIAVLAYGDHVPMEGVATDTVRVVVRAP
ncbi:MAG: DUF4399 domain-containing protein [Gemmatimonadetes bacterium]|nr:DUF4399 domain-containing protein [Gemmatimonadota bacterium]MBI2615059.1 DUF4399 domain-containing protein [Gemmatimonadota bacterium]